MPTYNQWPNSCPVWLPTKVTVVLVNVEPGAGELSGGGKVLVVVVLGLLVEVELLLEVVLPAFMV